jgi:D-alanyl-D-alanine carboxypeptidase
VGETINFKDLLYATMVRSGNAGANLIAETVSGSIDAFVGLMNQAAQAFGCTGTHFANPNGLPDDNHYTTARDMAKIARVAMQDATFQDIAKTYTYSLPKSNLSRARALIGADDNWLNPGNDNVNYYPYAIGIKTGFHSRAGYCYVGAAEKDGVRLISVVFYSSIEGRWTDTKKLMEYGFSQFMSVTPIELYDMNPTVIETTGYSMEDSDIGRLQLNISPMDGTRTVHIVATRTEVETLARNLKQAVIIDYTRENFAAPVTQGEVFGTLTYYPTDGGSAVTYQLVASRSIERRRTRPCPLRKSSRRPTPIPTLPAAVGGVRADRAVALRGAVPADQAAHAHIPQERPPRRQRPRAQAGKPVFPLAPGLRGEEGNGVYAQVVVDVVHTNVAKPFSYLVPEGMDVRPGMRVSVPLGRRQVGGVVVGLTEECDVPPQRMKPVSRTLDDFVAVPPPLMALAEELAREDHCPLAETLRLMFPSAMRTGRAQTQLEATAQLAPGVDASAAAAAQGRSLKRATLIRMLSDGEAHGVKELSALVAAPREALRQLSEAGLVVLAEREVFPPPLRGASGYADPGAAPDRGAGGRPAHHDAGAGHRRRRVSAARGHGQRQDRGLPRHGAARAGRGRAAIILVPEIALTPQMVRWFRERFGPRTALLHSRLTDGQRVTSGGASARGTRAW